MQTSSDGRLLLHPFTSSKGELLPHDILECLWLFPGGHVPPLLEAEASECLGQPKTRLDAIMFFGQ